MTGRPAGKPPKPKESDMDLLKQQLNQADLDANQDLGRLAGDDGGIVAGGHMACPTCAGATDRSGVDPPRCQFTGLKAN